MITRENSVIHLSWVKDDLFQTICTQTAYNARTLTDEKGQSLFDQYTMTDDERLFFDDHIARAVTSLLQYFRRIVPDSGPIVVEGATCGLAFSARLNADGEALYALAELEAIDQSAADVLRCMILAEWYLSVHANDLWTTYLQKLAVAVSALSNYLFRFYRPVLRTAFEVTPDPDEYPGREYEIHIDAGRI